MADSPPTGIKSIKSFKAIKDGKPLPAGTPTIYCHLSAKIIARKLRFEFFQPRTPIPGDLDAVVTSAVGDTLATPHNYRNHPAIWVQQPCHVVVHLHNSLDWYFWPDNQALMVEFNDLRYFANLRHVIVDNSGKPVKHTSVPDAPGLKECRIITFDVLAAPNHDLPVNFFIALADSPQEEVRLVFDPDVKNGGPPPNP